MTRFSLPPLFKRKTSDDSSVVEKNTQRNIELLQDSDASSCFDDKSDLASPSLSSSSSFDVAQNKAIRFNQYVEEILFVAAPESPSELQDENHAQLLALLGLDSQPAPKANADDAVMNALTKARSRCCTSDGAISIVPINDCGKLLKAPEGTGMPATATPAATDDGLADDDFEAEPIYCLGPISLVHNGSGDSVGSSLMPSSSGNPFAVE